AAGADSNAQALLDALARKVALELVSNTALTTKLADYLKKTDIVQTESTDTNKVPSSAYLKQVKDSIDSNLEWKLNGTYKATDTCPLPEKYNELMIKIYRTSDNAYTCGVNILKAELGKNTGNWMTGCGRDASGWDVKIVIAITSTIAINSVFINAADNKSNFSFVVYYR
ncbi:collagen-like protein, partial [Enterocloster bolteae]|uniref:collagen-like protein n=3 Tax=Enterocloster bolteae TaxID=208479 RepID=UPI001EE13DF7